jgi:hypothetical protein
MKVKTAVKAGQVLQALNQVAVLQLLQTQTAQGVG